MTREEKSQVIENLTAQLADSATIYLADISTYRVLMQEIRVT